jgi:hypothetical protein
VVTDSEAVVKLDPVPKSGVPGERVQLAPYHLAKLSLPETTAPKVTAPDPHLKPLATDVGIGGVALNVTFNGFLTELSQPVVVLTLLA